MAILLPYQSTWKYLIGAFGHSSGFQAPGFDDSGWSTGDGAFGLGGPSFADIQTAWSPLGTDICLRVEVTIPALTGAAIFDWGIDDEGWVYWDGVEVEHVYWHAYAAQDQNTFSIIAPTAGVHVLAVRGRDTGIASYFDMKVSTVDPTLDFSGTPLTGDRPLAVQFTDESSGAPSSWEWDFGDGTTSTEQHPLHVYVTAGTYTVSLVIPGYGSETKVDYITVTTADANEPEGLPGFGLWVDWDNDGFDDGTSGDLDAPLARMLPEGDGATSSDDVTDWVIDAKWQRGGQFDLIGGQQPGSMTVTLDNRDGRFFPDNAAGPFYGKLEPGRRVWLGALKTSAVYRGLFAGYLKEIVPIPRTKHVQFVVEDPFANWTRQRARVEFSQTRTAGEFRRAILDSMDITGLGGAGPHILDAEPQQLGVSGCDQRNGLAVLESLNQAIGTRHWIVPADVKDDFYFYRSLNRNRNLGFGTPTSALDDDDIAGMSGYRRTYGTVVNYQQVTTHQYNFTGSEEEVWRSGDVIVIATSTPSRKVVAAFSGWVRNPTLHLTVTSGAVEAVLTNFGKSALIELTATSDATIGAMWVTGWKATETGSSAEFAEDVSSQARFGFVEGSPVDVEFVSQPAQGKALAEALVARGRLPRTRPQVTIKNRFDFALTEDIGDVVSQTITEMSVTARRYEIVGSSGHIREGGLWIDFGWTYLETAFQSTLDLFTLNVSELDGPDVLGF